MYYIGTCDLRKLVKVVLDKKYVMNETFKHFKENQQGMPLSVEDVRKFMLEAAEEARVLIRCVEMGKGSRKGNQMTHDVIV